MSDENRKTDSESSTDETELAKDLPATHVTGRDAESVKGGVDERTGHHIKKSILHYP